MAHKTRWAQGGCYVDVFGEITSQELSQINSEMTGSPHFDDMKFFVRDLSGITRQSIDLDSIVVAAFCNQAASTYKRKLRGAFVVTDAATRERVLHYIAESRALGSTWELRMFEDQRSANAWATQDTNPASPTN